MDARSRLRSSAPFLIAGSVLSAIGAVVPISYDEGEWLAVVRRVAGGARLYEDVIDNKSPVVYWTIRLLDLAPGPFQIARGIALAAVACVIGMAIARIATARGVAEDRARVLGVAITFVVALQSVFVINIETGATLLITIGMLAIVTGRIGIGSAVAATSVVVDPRALALLIGIALFVREIVGARPALLASAIVAGVGGAWATVVLSSPNLRYAIIELNVATRGTLDSWRPGEVLISTVVAVLPFIAATYVVTGRLPWRLRWNNAGGALFVMAAAVAFASRFPFLKYWILAVPALPLLVAASSRDDERPAEPKRSWIPIALAAIPLAVQSVPVHLTDARLLADYERASRYIEATLEPGETFAQFDTQPYMSMLQPGHASLSWVVYDFIWSDTSRIDEHLDQIERAVESATVLQHDGALDAPRSAVRPELRPAWDLFKARLDAYPCIRRFGSVVLRFPEARCRP